MEKPSTSHPRLAFPENYDIVLEKALEKSFKYYFRVIQNKSSGQSSKSYGGKKKKKKKRNVRENLVTGNNRIREVC